MYEQRIEIKNVLRWFWKCWKIILVGIAVITVVTTIGFYVNAKNAYKEELSKRYTKEEFEASMSKYDCQVAKAVCNIDDLLKAKNQRLEDINQEYVDPSSASEDILCEKEELLQRIYWLSQLRAMYFIDFTDEQSRYYNLLCGNDYPPLTTPTVTSRMIFEGALLGFMVMVVSTYLFYVLGGYLHSAKEISANFKIPMIKFGKKDTIDQSYMSLWTELEEMEICGNSIVIDMTAKKPENEKSIQTVTDFFGGELVDGHSLQTNQQQRIHENKNVYIITAVNDSKVMKIKKTKDLCETLGASVKGIIVITE